MTRAHGNEWKHFCWVIFKLLDLFNFVNCLSFAGDKGPEVFYEVQQQVVQTLEDKYYQPFIISNFYMEMLKAITNEDGVTEIDAIETVEEKQLSGEVSSSFDNSLHVGDHSNYARRKLDQLQEKLNNKMQALQALRSSLKPESRVLKILEKEVEWLEGEKRQLEAHISRTEVWGENLGKWRAVVQSADVNVSNLCVFFKLNVAYLGERRKGATTVCNCCTYVGIKCK